MTPSEAACKRIDPTAKAQQLDGGWWYISGDSDQALAFDAGHLEDPEAPFDTEAEAWLSAERFLLSRTPLTA